jgi:hypothetical protein
MVYILYYTYKIVVGDMAKIITIIIQRPGRKELLKFTADDGAAAVCV